MTLHTILTSSPARDGAGVNINRIAGRSVHALLDPFLMVDEIRSDSQDDYMAGFPPHPHRGFETITYLLNGKMRHEDHLGNSKVMADGGVQWMTTGRGIIHSEMPEATAGVFHGFQIWLNLPAEMKMIEPAYHDLPAEDVATAALKSGSLKLFSGALSVEGQVFQVDVPTPSSTDPVIADVAIDPGQTVALSVSQTANLMAFVYDGEEQEIGRGQMGVFGEGRATLTAANEGARVLLLAGEPLREPIVQHGPFVMNSSAQIEQAVRDFSSGQLAANS